jgi:hypothetical protein
MNECNVNENSKKVTGRYVHQAAKLIAPVIDKDMPSGFDWVVEALKAPRRAPGSDSEAAVGAAYVHIHIHIHAPQLSYHSLQ